MVDGTYLRHLLTFVEDTLVCSLKDSFLSLLINIIFHSQLKDLNNYKWKWFANLKNEWTKEYHASQEELPPESDINGGQRRWQNDVSY